MTVRQLIETYTGTRRFGVSEEIGLPPIAQLSKKTTPLMFMFQQEER